MMNNSQKSNRILKITGIIATVIILVFSAIITFVPGVNLSWRQIIDTVFVKSTLSLDDQIVFLDVGQSDSTLIMSNGEVALVDLGNLSGGGRNVTEDLKKRAINDINYIIITHYHADHMGVIKTIAENFNIKNVIINKNYSVSDTDAEAINDFFDVIEDNNINLEYATDRKQLQVGDFQLTLFVSNLLFQNENENCTVVSANCKSVKTLLMADAGYDMINNFFVYNYYGEDIAHDILKVGHHGSKDSTKLNFLKLIGPKDAVISCGKNNLYGHPNIEILEMLNEVGANVYRTDLDGDITVKITDEDVYEISSKK